MSPPNARAAAVALVLACGVAFAASGQPMQRTLDVGFGPQRLWIVDASAAVSESVDLGLGEVDKSGLARPAQDGPILAARVVVRAATDAPITERRAADNALAIGVAGPTIVAHESLHALPGWWTVETTSIAEAIALADALRADPRVAYAAVDADPVWSTRTLPSDPNFWRQWHLSNAADPLFDANVEPAWDAGFTGSGITIGIVELSFQRTHPDLAPNYDAVNSVGTDAFIDSHATSVAGVAAAVANNGTGGSGAAYNAHLARLVYGSNSVTGSVLAHAGDIIGVKNNSWGPADNNLVSVMPPEIAAGIEQGIATGRGGLGTIYVWAAGNGGNVSDRSDYDPFVSWRYTIGVNAIDDDDDASYYAEDGSGVLVAAHSSGDQSGTLNRKIYTTTTSSSYTTGFGGTSSAAPLASGVVALILQANPALTWRDVQHVLVNSARECDFGAEEWITNGAGHLIHPRNGFGAIDAAAAVALAQSWENVGPESSFDTGDVVLDLALPDNDPAGVNVPIAVSADISVEHVELYVTATTLYRGDLYITITSPAGTPSILAVNRSDSGDNYDAYRFTTVRNWDESSLGTWTVHVSDRGAGDVATLDALRLVVYGAEAGCPGDWDGSGGQPNSGDFLAYLNDWAAHEPDADLAPPGGDGSWDSSDFLAYLNLYVQGC
jgi:subtilisin-like proprotein convertase family protein